jgi:lipopolysaccharide/colanic/teichoic acid biosynthesis glycosyltransferase
MNTDIQTRIDPFSIKRTRSILGSSSGGLNPFLQRFIASLSLILLSPFLLVVAIIISLESPGHAIFRQTRVGLNGRRFSFYKFRSMRTSSDPDYPDMNTCKSDREGICQKLFNDPRVTTFGRFIRKYSIDELPQLLNVVKGDMLLIGPRPALVNECDQYSMHARKRLYAAPGLTGLWQVSGRADTTFEEQIELDLRYVNDRNWAADLQILFATIPVVLFGKGAY